MVDGQLRYLSDSPSLPLARSWVWAEEFSPSRARIGSGGDQSSWRGGVCCREIGGGAACGDEFAPERTTSASWGEKPCCPAPPCECATTKKEAGGGEYGTGERNGNRASRVMVKRCVGARSDGVCGGGPHLRGCGGSYRGVICGLFVGWWPRSPRLRRESRTLPSPYSYRSPPPGRLCDHGRRARCELTSHECQKALRAQFFTRRNPEMEAFGFGPSLPGRSPLVQVTRKKNSGEEGTLHHDDELKFAANAPAQGWRRPRN